MGKMLLLLLLFCCINVTLCSNIYLHLSSLIVSNTDSNSKNANNSNINNNNNNSNSNNNNNNNNNSGSDTESNGMTFRRPKDRTNVNNNNGGNTASTRREQTRDLKRLIQELEESDYGNYGSWGNFRSRNRAQMQQQVQEEDQDSIATRELYQDVPLEDDASIVSDYGLSDIEDIYLERANGLQRQPPIDNIRSDDEGSLSSREFVLRRDTWKRLVDDDAIREFDPNNYLASDTVLKVSGLIILGTFLSYMSVSPRTLPLVEYNSEYKASLLRITSAAVWPCVLLAIVYRGKDANINRVIDTLTTSIIVGYPVLCIIEAILATLIRLIIIKICEPDAFKLCPRVPALLLPWRLTSEGYFPSRVTLVLFSACNNCIMAPIIEELFKAHILIQALKKNTNTKDRLNNDIRKSENLQSSIAPLPPISNPDAHSQSENKNDVIIADRSNLAPLAQQRYLEIVSKKWVTIRTYVIFMLAASLGLKIVDNTRRILLYSHPYQRHKSFFAVARSFFPVQELCGAMTALALGRRDLIGHKVSIFEAVRPAIFLHVMASLRGVKPMFVWNSHRPWDEIQLQAWNAADNSAPQQLFLSGAMNMLWFIVIIKSLTNVVQQFVIYSRQFFIQLRNELENTNT